MPSKKRRGPKLGFSKTRDAALLYSLLAGRWGNKRAALRAVSELFGVHPRNLEREANADPFPPVDGTEVECALCALSRWWGNLHDRMRHPDTDYEAIAVDRWPDTLRQALENIGRNRLPERIPVAEGLPVDPPN